VLDRLGEGEDIFDMGKEERRFQEVEKIYVKRDSSSGRFIDIKPTKSGRTLLKSPVKSDTKGSSWKRAFKK
jgi:hypothetical protein